MLGMNSDIFDWMKWYVLIIQKVISCIREKL